MLIVDDHPVVRNGLAALLGTVEGYEVVGEAADGAEALAVAAERRPDVVLMDLAMPRVDGIEATRRLTAQRPGVAVLVLTMSDDDASVLAAMRAGARGYLLKDATQQEMLAAVRSAAQGQLVFGTSIAPAVTSLLMPRDRPDEEPFPQLTPRERSILALVAEGLGNQAIARRLAVRPKTVANAVSAILVKIHARDRAAAIAAAREAGLGGGTS
ncbi:response regulator transcription factor [Thermopolyspora sp. NPDC052614]|uniref:response regulator transcription factor n=1 Tax=Thermopolyspora sp. NPDC052614 TaxID=3155682 RepID=UPI00343B4F28